MTHSAILETATLHWNDEQGCRVTAQALATAKPSQAILTLHGDLGAGKTTFTRHLLQALGVEGRIKSPTYTVMETYDVGWPVAHFDFYRFADPQEWEDAGFRDVFSAAGLKICEWPERVHGLLPAPDLAVHMRLDAGEVRLVRLDAHTAEGLRLLRATVAGRV